MNENIFPQHNIKITLNIPVDNAFVNSVGTTFYEDKYCTDCCLNNYKRVLYYFVYDNKDLLVSFRNKLEHLQYFQLHISLKIPKLMIVKIYFSCSY
jgi:hypothetical protein